MLDEGYIRKILGDKLGIILDGCSIKRLAGDASNRAYYRISTTNQQSYTIMELSYPEAFKASEEKISSSAVPVTELPFINISRFLLRYGVGVPEIYYYDRERGVLFLEDLGDATMQEVLQGGSPDRYDQYYKMAIDELLTIQIYATKGIDHNCIASGRRFDIPLLMWEFDHYIEYGVEARSGIKIPKTEQDEIRETFYKISGMLASEPACLTHRDYHSRNLMIKDERVRVIDFQDALMGPCIYDLASLLRDSYLELDDKLVDNLIGYYIRKRREIEGIELDKSRFRRVFDLMSIQRNMKAVGRFIYINVVKKRDTHLKYIPGTLGYIKKNLQKYRELKNLQKVLARYVKELS